MYILAFLPSGMTLIDLKNINEVEAEFEPVTLEDILEFFKEFGITDKENIQM